MINPFLWSMANLNPIANFILYTTRHMDLKYGIKHFLLCKPLTAAFLKNMEFHKIEAHAQEIHNHITVQTVC